jgi:hypothetical protein
VDKAEALQVISGLGVDNGGGTVYPYWRLLQTELSEYRLNEVTYGNR